MPFLIKGTWIFESRQTGWTESLYWNQSTGNLNTAYQTAFAVGDVRKQLLGDTGSIKAIRVSVEANELGQPVVGDSLLSYARLAPDTLLEEEDSNTALQVIFRTSDATKRKFLFLRGIWDSIVQVGGVYNKDANGWVTKFNAWKTEVIGQAMGWVASSRSTAGTITNYVMDANGFITFTLAAPGIFGAGPNYTPQKVRISRLNGRSTLNGTMIVFPTSATTATSAQPHAAAPFKSNGIMFGYTKALVLASTIEAQKIVTRKAGAPLLGSVGRQKAKPKA